MKQLIKLSLLMLALLMPAVAMAEDFTVGGVYYNINGDEAIVTYKGASPSSTFYEYVGNVTIPETVTWEGKTYPVTAIGEGAFNNCTELTGITIPNSIIDIRENAFAGCNRLTSVEIPNSVTAIGTSAFDRCSNLVSATIGNSVLTIANNAFAQCGKLHDLVIGNSVTSIGLAAFTMCYSLGSVNIPSSVTEIGSLAFDDANVDYITVDDDNPKYDSRDNCNAIIETATNKLMEGCITTTIPSTVTEIAAYAFNDRQLTTFVVPDNVTVIGSSAFALCRQLTSITLPNSITEIKFNTFSSCKSLASIDIPNTVTSIGSAAFSYCDSLTSVVIPNSVTEILSSAFYLCKNLTTVTIPGSVTQIGMSAFYDCGNLTTVYSHISDPSAVTIGYNAFQDYPTPHYDRRTLYVPRGTTEAYQNHTAWGPYFGTIIEMEPELQPGDIDGDGKVNISDVALLINLLLEEGDLPDYADVDGDGKINISDVAALIDILLNGNVS